VLSHGKLLSSLFQVQYDIRTYLLLVIRKLEMTFKILEFKLLYKILNVLSFLLLHFLPA